MNGSRSAFTLLEVMVALAIIAVSVTPLMIVRNRAIEEAGDAMRARRVHLLLESKMAEIQARRVQSNGGSFDPPSQDYLWRVERRSLEVREEDDREGIAPIAIEQVTLRVWHQSTTEAKGKTLVSCFLVKDVEK